jgi:hypothetical protein
MRMKSGDVSGQRKIASMELAKEQITPLSAAAEASRRIVGAAVEHMTTGEVP